MDYFNYSRRKSSVVNIGNTPLGGENPIRIQSMANVSTMDTEASVRQAIRMIEAGAEYVRFTAQGEREARNLGEIRKELNAQGYTTPLVADIHFNASTTTGCRLGAPVRRNTAPITGSTPTPMPPPKWWKKYVSTPVTTLTK